MKNEFSERLGKIESHIAHLEHQVEQLNEVIIEQGKELETLKKLVLRQAATMESLEMDRIKATNTKPPHH